MENFYSRIRNFTLQKKDKINAALATFSKKEWVIFGVLFLTLLISATAIVQNVNKSLMVSVPLRGGSVSVGIIGTPRFINPVLATSPVDQDMVSLVYSGLMRKGPDGTLIPDLAEKYEMSKNGLIYTFTLRDKIFFQDGEPITADDIVFTINNVKDSIIKSPRKTDWDGVTVAKIDDKTLEFTLKQPYSSFLENATLGIMPEHLWSNSPIELNTANISPVGSGPYKIENVIQESSGIINSFGLSSFKKFILGEPYIKNLSLYFYSNEESLLVALDKKEVNQISSITPLNADILKERNYEIESSVLPRVFGLFFNQNQNQLFADKVVAKAIDRAIDKNKIIYYFIINMI